MLHMTLPNDTPGVPPLSIYTVYFYNAFIVGVTMAGINAIFLFWPPVKADKSNFTCWLFDSNARGLSCLAGVVASIGEGIQLMGGTHQVMPVVAVLEW